MAAGDTLLAVERLTKRYRGVTALNDVSFTITDGGGNTGWYPSTPYCGPWPAPVYTYPGGNNPPPTTTTTTTTTNATTIAVRSTTAGSSRPNRPPR